MALDTVDQALKRFNLCAPKPSCQTEKLPIIGGANYNKDGDLELIEKYGFARDVAAYLHRTYGDQAERVARLAQQHPRRVAVVDLDLQFGDIAFALSLNPRHSIKDAAASTGVDTTALKVFLTPHPAGLYALCAPGDPADGDDIDPVATGEILTRLAEEFDFVVIDTGAGLTEHTLAALDVSTDVVLVADADVPSIRHMAKVVEALDGLQMKALTRHLILNRADARIGIRIGDVLDGVGLETDLEIPTSREVAISLSKGEPIVLSNAKSAMAKRVAQLAERIGESGEARGKAERSAS
jgi:pilus assembly protein CpaE